MELLKTIQRAIDSRKETLLLILQGLTALGVILTIILMIHVGPLTLFAFMPTWITMSTTRMTLRAVR